MLSGHARSSRAIFRCCLASLLGRGVLFTCSRPSPPGKLPSSFDSSYLSLVQEASSPFVCLLHVLRELGITGGKLYAANGVVMTITFGLFRGGLLYRCGPLGTFVFQSSSHCSLLYTSSCIGTVRPSTVE